MKETIMTVAEVATAEGVTPASIYNWMKNKENKKKPYITGFFRAGKSYLFNTYKVVR